ncbi:UNVERIFIED_ORG: ANTAR domain-containing protein [Gordonia westfalica J30]
MFADLTSLALSAAGGADARQVRLEESIDSVLEGVTVTATAVGIIAEIRGVDLTEARVLLTRLARAHAVTPTTHARSIVAAQREHPRDPESTGLLGFPEFGTLPADES